MRAWKKWMDDNRDRGFTVIEMVVALAVFSIGGLGIVIVIWLSMTTQDTQQTYKQLYGMIYTLFERITSNGSLTTLNADDPSGSSGPGSKTCHVGTGAPSGSTFKVCAMRADPDSKGAPVGVGYVDAFTGLAESTSGHVNLDGTSVNVYFVGCADGFNTPGYPASVPNDVACGPLDLSTPPFPEGLTCSGSELADHAIAAISAQLFLVKALMVFHDRDGNCRWITSERIGKLDSLS